MLSFVAALKTSPSARLLLVTFASVSLLHQPARALVSLNEGSDHINVTGTFGVTHDSNIFANRDAEGDYVSNAGFSAEYTRRAGWIGVNATGAIAVSHFDEHPGEDFQNPQLALELTKQTGRTTGSLSLGAQRQNRPDSEVNLRTASWNYTSTLNFHYPVIERYSLSGSLGYSWIDYSDDILFVDLKTYSASLNLFYILDTAHDLFFGYRYRYGDGVLRSTNTDHALNLGVSGRILPLLNGAISVGYQKRHPSVRGESDHDSTTAQGSLTYNLTRKVALTGQLTKDFTTSATNTSVDSTTASLDLQYAVTARLTASADVGGSRQRFLGSGGLVAGSSSQREDTAFTWDAILNYRFSQHLTVAAGYYFYQNWSNLPVADFVRHSWNLSLTSRW